MKILNRRDRGFTLVEVMIVVVILSIIAAFSMSAHSRSVQKSRISTGIQELASIASEIEQLRLRGNGYNSTAVSEHVTAKSPIKYSGKDIYTVALDATAIGYKLTATRKNSKDIPEKCKILTLSNGGAIEPSECRN